MSWIDKRDEQLLLAEIQQTQKTKGVKKPTDVVVGQRLSQIYNRHPYIPTGVALSLAEANADMATVDAVAMRSTTNKYIKMADEQQGTKAIDDLWKNPATWDPNAGIGWDDIVKPVTWLLGKTGKALGELDALKTASRYTFATLESSKEHMANYLSRLTDPNRGTNDLTDASVSTSIGALLKWPELQGDGFFISDELEEKRVEAVRRYRWQLANGDSYTPGRGGAQMVFTPGSKPYEILSGFIDAAFAFRTDPANAPLDELAKFNKARKVIPALRSADEISAAKKFVSEAGLMSNAEQHAIDTSKFFNWMDNSRMGKRTIARTAAESNELKILEAYNYKISPQTARDLARTSDPNEIRGIIANAAIRLSDETEQGMIPFATSAAELPIASMWDAAVEKIPGYNAIKESRWLAKTPKNNIVVNGTPQQKADGIKNMKNWLTLLKVDPYEGEGKQLMEAAFTWAGANGNRANADDMLDLFLGNRAKKVPGILPTAIRKELLAVKPALTTADQWSKDVDDVISSIEETLRGGEALLRKYAIDNAGISDDHGIFMHLSQHMTGPELADTLNELFPNKIDWATRTEGEMRDFVASLGPGRIVVNGPTTLSQMLNNVVTLPDPQQIRKLTTNPFFKVSKDGKQALTSAFLEEIQNDWWRPWALATFGFIMRNTFDAQARIAMSGMVRNNPLDYILIAMNKRGVGTIAGDEWMGVDNIPNWKIGRIAGAKGVGSLKDPRVIQELLDPHVGQISDDVMQELVKANRIPKVKEILERIRRADEVLEEYSDFTQSFSRRMVEDPRNTLDRLIQTKQVSVADYSDKNFWLGLADTAGLYYGDPFSKFAARIAHLPEPRQKEVIVQWLQKGSKEATRAKNTIIDYLSAPTVAQKTNGKNRTVARVANIGKLSDEELVELWYQTGAREGVDQLTQGTDEMRTFVGYRSVPVAPAQIVDEDAIKALNNGKIAKAGDVLMEEYDEIIERGGEELVQTRVRQHLVLERDLVPKSKPPVYKYKTIEIEDFDSAFGQTRKGETFVSPKAKKFLDQQIKMNAELLGRGQRPILPTRTLYRVRDIDRTAMDKVQAGVTWIPRKFFELAVGPYVERWERSPAFRRSYYNAIADNAKLLDPDEASKVLEAIREAAEKKFPVSYANDIYAAMEHYAGGKPVIDALSAAMSAPAGSGIGTAEQLQTYAMTIAKREVEELFFNNVERSNFTDAMRVVAPFGAAWAEIAGTYGKALVQNPARLRKATLVYRGAEGYDPDNDGRGMIWTDPQSKLQMFAFPLSGAITKAVTAAMGQSVDDSFLAAPTRRLSAGFSLIPSLGPVYAIAASQIFNKANVPSTDAFRKILLPYGDAGLEGMIPGALNKFVQAIDANIDNLNNVYGNTFQDVFAHLATTGKYDLTDRNDVARMEDDAKQGARGMTIIRAISQFVGPTSGSPQYRYRKESGELFFVNEMVKAYSDFQNENFDTAVSRFIEIFGYNSLIYLSGKTKVDESYKGIEATEEYGRWEQENRQLIKTYKDTAPFLAPGSFGELSMEVYSRQLGAGIRKDRDNFDRLADAQRRIGSAIYKWYRNQYPETLNDAQRERLRQYRVEIHDKFPGFPIKSEFKAGEFDNWITRLGDLVQDPRTQGNPVRDAIWDYLRYRANIKTSLKQKYGVSIEAEKNIGAQRARGALYAKGEELATLVPDFRRIWDQELAQEVE